MNHAQRVTAIRYLRRQWRAAADQYAADPFAGTRADDEENEK